MTDNAAKCRKLIAALQTKRPDAANIVIDADNWDIGILQNNIGGQGLFSNKSIVFLDRVMANDEAEESLPKFLEEMSQSENIFICLEGKLNAEQKKAFVKYAEKVVASEDVVSKPKGDVSNIFALADALGERNALRAWSIFRENMDNGAEAEGVAGTIFWQVKAMILAQGAKSAKEAGLNPFVYGKASRFARNYSVEELSLMARQIILAYHEGHRGNVDLEFGIERMLLSISRNHGE